MVVDRLVDGLVDILLKKSFLVIMLLKEIWIDENSLLWVLVKCFLRLLWVSSFRVLVRLMIDSILSLWFVFIR